MARINIIALENNDTNTEHEVDLLESEQLGTSIDKTVDAVDEATSITGTMDQIATVVASNEVSDETAKVVQIVTEHFCKRLGYKRNSMNTALESFVTSRQNKQELLNELNIAQEAVGKQLAIAQEGLWARIKHRVSLFFTNDAAILKNLEKVNSEYEAKGAKEGYLDKPGFSKYLNPREKDSLKSKDIIDEFAGLNSLTSSADLAKSIKTIASSLKSILHAKVKSEHGDITTIINEHSKLKTMLKEIEKKYTVRKKGYNEADIEVLKAADEAKLYKLISTLLGDTLLDDAFEALDAEMDYVYEQVIVKNTTGRSRSSDGRGNATSTTDNRETETSYTIISKAEERANDAYDTVQEILYVFSEICSVRQAWCHAGVAYIKASTK